MYTLNKHGPVSVEIFLCSALKAVFTRPPNYLNFSELHNKKFTEKIFKVNNKAAGLVD